MPAFDMQPPPSQARTRCRPAALALAMACSLAAPLAAQAAPDLRVVRDPLTGELRGPNAAEVAAFEKAETQLRQRSGKPAPAKQPVEIRYPDGTVETKLDEDTRMYSVVRAAEDGTLTTACLPAKQAQAFVKGASSKKSSAVKGQAQAQAMTKAGHSHE